MTGWSEFFAMGGYGIYVWPAFGLSAVLLVLVLVVSLRFLKSQTSLLNDLESQNPD